MASIKVKFRPSTTANKEGTIYYQIIQNRVIRQLKTDYTILNVRMEYKYSVDGYFVHYKFFE